MELQIGKTYHRHDPGGRVVTIEVRNAAELKYHQSLADAGYRYEPFYTKK